MNVRQGVVISVHALGAAVRLDDGRLASVPAPEVARHRPRLLMAMSRREAVSLDVQRRGRHLIASLSGPAEIAARPDAPSVTVLHKDDAFEAVMNAYLKSVEEREPPDRPPAAERHFIRKKRRATIFESRHREN